MVQSYYFNRHNITAIDDLVFFEFLISLDRADCAIIDGNEQNWHFLTAHYYIRCELGVGRSI